MSAGDASRSPEERLEWLRFCAAEGENVTPSLAAWMQEAEEQIAKLRERLNNLPRHATREPIRW